MIVHSVKKRLLFFICRAEGGRGRLEGSSPNESIYSTSILLRLDICYPI